MAKAINNEIVVIKYLFTCAMKLLRIFLTLSKLPFSNLSNVILSIFNVFVNMQQPLSKYKFISKLSQIIHRLILSRQYIANILHVLKNSFHMLITGATYIVNFQYHCLFDITVIVVYCRKW